MKYESAFAGVKKTVSATDDEFQAISDGLREMSTEIPTSAADLADLAASAGQLGIQTENILGFTKVVAQMGEATNLVGEEGASQLARFANITNMSQESFDRLGSTLVALGNNFPTTESEIMTMGLRLAAAGEQVGMTESEILGLSAALSSVGIEAEAGGTAVSKVLVNMSASAATFDNLQNILTQTGMSLRDIVMLKDQDGKGYKALAASLNMTSKELTALVNNGTKLEDFGKIAGMSAAEFKTAFESDTTGALQSFIGGLAGAEAQGTTAIAMLQDMGLSEVRLRDALLRMTNSSENMTGAIMMSNEAWEDNSALQKEVENRYSTLESKLGMLKNTATDFGISLYQSSSDGLGGIVDLAKGYMMSLTEAFNSGGLDALVEQIGVVINDAINRILTALPDVVPAVLDIIGKIGGAITDNLPLVIDAAGQILFAVIDGIIGESGNLGDTALQLIMTLLTGLLDRLPDVVQFALNIVLALVEGIGNSLPELVPAIVGCIVKIVQVVIENLPKILEVAFKVVSSLATGLVGSVGTLADAVPELIKSIVSTIIQLLPQIVVAAVMIVAQLAVGLIGAIPKLIAAIPEIIVSIVAGLIDGISKIGDVGKRMVEGLWEGIKSMGKWVTDNVKNFFSGIVNNVKGLLGIHSPSKVFAGIGDNMALGLGEGFEKSMKDIEKDIQSSIPTDFDLAANVRMGASPVTAYGSVQSPKIIIQSDTYLDGKKIADSSNNHIGGFNAGYRRAMGVT